MAVLEEDDADEELDGGLIGPGPPDTDNGTDTEALLDDMTLEDTT